MSNDLYSLISYRIIPLLKFCVCSCHITFHGNEIKISYRQKLLKNSFSAVTVYANYSI